eukprot:1296655-Alexandrium_andersonii.AAC.1
MGLKDGWAKMFCVRADALEKHPKAYSAYLATGTSRLRTLCPELSQWLEVEGLQVSDVVVETDVEAWSFGRLAQEFRIG